MHRERGERSRHVVSASRGTLVNLSFSSSVVRMTWSTMPDSEARSAVLLHFLVCRVARAAPTMASVTSGSGDCLPETPHRANVSFKQLRESSLRGGHNRYGDAHYR